MLRDRSLVAVLLLALVLRLATVLWLSDTVPFSDGRYYHLAAQRWPPIGNFVRQIAGRVLRQA
jgi:hypothetical protein